MVPSSPAACSGASHLTDHDRRVIEQAGDLARYHTTAALRERFPGWGDSTAAVYAEAFGVARYHLAELIAIVERLGGEG